MLIVATLPLPYGYYILLRWVVCVVAVGLVYESLQSDAQWMVWLFGFVAILFNPLVPVSLSRPVWLPIDLLLAVAFLVLSGSSPQRQAID